MIRFEEHEGQLFRMLDKPVPLTADSNMPCLVRLIQDDSPMGKYNRDAAYFDVIGKLFIAQKIKENPYYNNKLHAYEKNSINQDYCIASIHTLEIIGYPVEEGSKDWALYQMMQWKIVCHKKSPSIMYCKRDSKIMREVRCGCVDFMSIDAWLNGADNTGWQIYEEPKIEQQNPMPTTEFVDLSDAPAGWICKTRDGGNYPLKYIEVSPTRYAYEDKSGLTVYVMANGRYKKNGTDGRDIIACEPEQPKYKLGDWVDCKDPVGVPTQCKVLEILEHNVIVECKTGHRWSLPHNNIIRKLSPSEIVVRIGCLSGTVTHAISDDCFILAKVNDPQHRACCIDMSMLDKETREFVEDLLEAQEEE